MELGVARVAGRAGDDDEEGAGGLHVPGPPVGVVRPYKGKQRNECQQKASSYIAQYPVLRTVQSALHVTSLTDLFTETPSRLLWEAFSHMLPLMREGCSYTYPPLSIARCRTIWQAIFAQRTLSKMTTGDNNYREEDLWEKSVPVLLKHGNALFPKVFFPELLSPVVVLLSVLCAKIVCQIVFSHWYFTNDLFSQYSAQWSFAQRSLPSGFCPNGVLPNGLFAQWKRGEMCL